MIFGLPQVLDLLGFGPGDHVAVCHQRPGGPFGADVVPVEQAGAIVAVYVGTHDVWFGVCPVAGPARSGAGRGRADDVDRVSGLWSDLDVKLGGLSTFDVAWFVVDVLTDMLGTPPTVVILSGHGVQPIWAIEVDDGKITCPEQRVVLAGLVRRWGRLVAMVAERSGGRVDSVYDLARVLRVPGTTNYKSAPVPVVGFPRGGSPVTVERLLDVLDEYGIGEITEDRLDPGAVLSAPADWRTGPATCNYAAAMITGWSTEVPTGRHPWLVAQAVRLAAAHRNGCLTEVDLVGGAEILRTRFEDLCARRDPVRKPGPGEISGALSWGRARVAAMGDDRVRRELGGHAHPEPVPAAPVAGQLPDPFSNGNGNGHGPETEDRIVLLDPFDRAVETELVRLRVREEATRQHRRGKTAENAPAAARLDDLLAVEDEETRYRITGLLPVGGRAVLAAQYKAGKTTLLGNLVRSLADGDPFLDGFGVELPDGGVLLVDDELDVRMLRRWLRDQRVAAVDRVHVVSLRGKTGTFDLLDPDVRSEWAEKVRGTGASVLLLDCLRPVLDSLGLSEDKDAGRFLVGFDALLSEAGISEAIVTHHMGHTGERTRGDSRIRDWPDVEWKILREATSDDDPVADAHARRFFSGYGRDVDVREGLLTYESITRRLVFAGGSRVDQKANAAWPEISELLHQHPEGLSGRQFDELLKTSDHSRAARRSALRRAIETGVVITAPGPRRSDLHLLSAPVRRSAPDDLGALDE